MYKCIVVVYMKTTLFSNILTSYCMLGHQILLVYKILDVYIPLTVFETLGFKLKNENDKKNWRNRLFATSPMLVVQFQPNIRYTYIDLSYHPVVLND